MTTPLSSMIKLPLGGVDRRSMVTRLATDGPVVAEADLRAARAKLVPTGVELPEGSAVLLLGGSGGILRALAIQLLFGEKVPVYCVHYDSEKLQIGGHQARAIAAAAEAEGVRCVFHNADATRPETVAHMMEQLRGRHRVVHLVNGIANGATKRFAEHGPTQVRDLDVAFDPVRQVPDFSSWDNLRRAGLVDVEVATEMDIDRTYKFMGNSTTPWAEALAAEGLLVKGESLVAFADYDYEPDDPVYAMGPLARAKVIQRESMADIEKRHGVRSVRLCYPAMNTTALGTIPGGVLMFAGTAQLLLEQDKYRNIPLLARDTMPVFSAAFREHEARYDLAYQSVRPEFHRRKALLVEENLRDNFSRVFGNKDL